MELSFPPFETIDTEGKPSGISVEIAKSLGTYLDREVRIENVSYIGLIPALKSGKIDIILSSYSATPERGRSITFSDPYLSSGICFLVARKSEITDIVQLKEGKKKIAVKQGTICEPYARMHFANCEILILEKDTSCVMELLQGKVDAFLYDQLSIFNFSQQYSKETRAFLEPVASDYWVMGLRKNDSDLQKQVNDFIHNSLQKGKLTELKMNYLEPVHTMCKEQGVTYCFE